MMDVAGPRLDRRRFLQGGAAVLLVPALPALAQAQAGPQAGPKKGGRFRLGLSGANTTDSHNPATWGTSSFTNIGLWGAVYNNLMEVGPDGKLLPELAESVEPSKDAKTWVFRLR